MMQRFLINLGKRDGYIKKCITKDRVIRFADFCATNVEKEWCWHKKCVKKLKN